MSKSFQDASQEYLLARQRMNEKVNLCKEIEAKMTDILHQIQDAYAARGDQAKTVGTLTVSVEATEGDVPEGSVIKVFVEPESFPDFEEIDEMTEKKNQVTWTNTEALPATFVFDAIQQREAVVHITIGEDKEDAEPIKEFTFPIASLFRGSLDSWYNLANGEAEAVAPVEVPAAAPVSETASSEEPRSTTQSTTETIFGIPPASTPATETTEESKTTEDKDADTFHDAVQVAQVEEETKTKEAPKEETKTEEAPKEETKTEEAPKEETPVEAAKEEVSEEARKEASAEPSKDSEVTEVQADEAAKEEKATEESKETTDEAPKEDAPVYNARVHIKASFVLSEIESLAQQAVVLSKAKADMDVEIRLCDQELSSARIRYERLKASQKPVTSSAGGGLLAGMKSKAALARAPPKPQTLYERTVSTFNSTFTPQRRSLAWSVAFFVVVSAVFHTNGDDLLI
ncbi:hypothetical protein LEN26_020096 [Aphanomyces euteiches]|nr:hypothetical protein LEN26_020096 [Aphanomyces euteiches]KAH9115354.1 hypothetical protein AeMF1_010620 [Aphanomyces euteiches]KAH9196715.1 hypothetical protein AeNC1_001289 [Aphanomyces euteiches]